VKTVRVDLGKRSYDILIGAGLLDQFPQFLERCGTGKRVFLISNAAVSQLFGKNLLERLSVSGYQVAEVFIPDGEAHKSLKTVEDIYSALITQGADRSSTLVALGGGVTGDVVGFVAATFLRGIPYLQIPTTLLSQVDSSVGGKTGVNHRLGKNMIGAFYQPHLVCIDTDTLASLPPREFQSGLYEVVKYGLICDSEFFEYFESNLEEIQKRKPDVLEELISRCCEIKAEITSSDEKEQGLRRILNFGHTFGHALEGATEFQRLSG
jgi:3-dehydroquinate synthase